MVAVNWVEFEREWIDAIALACSEIRNESPQEELYAGAFWLLYGDYKSLLVPAFALNCEAHATLTEESGQAIDVRWDPSEWKWSSVDQAVEYMRPLYKQFIDLDISAEDFEQLWESHAAMLAKVCRTTTSCARARSGKFSNIELPSKFLVGIIDWAQGDDLPKLLRLSLSEEVLVEHDTLLLEALRT
ncbi:MAG: DUF4303 domain-containing protein [Pseudomonas sp.]|uniref:DUF4303 domain-containing protein n=1 Tax=Pseudomonas sp. TaxID=306 RepID=UPI0033934744